MSTRYNVRELVTMFGRLLAPFTDAIRSELSGRPRPVLAVALPAVDSLPDVRPDPSAFRRKQWEPDMLAPAEWDTVEMTTGGAPDPFREVREFVASLPIPSPVVMPSAASVRKRKPQGKRKPTAAPSSHAPEVRPDAPAKFVPGDSHPLADVPAGFANPSVASERVELSRRIDGKRVRVELTRGEWYAVWQALFNHFSDWPDMIPQLLPRPLAAPLLEKLVAVVEVAGVVAVGKLCGVQS